ncbi:MAG TPA: hypothetical protein VF950_12870 [Planctomycetota bacterium]
MARLTLSEFLNNRSLLAIKVSSSDLGGFFRKAITIPLHTVGLALFHDGTSALVAEAQEVAGHFDLVLAKRGEFQVKLDFPDLKTADHLPLAAGCVVALELSLGRLDLFRDFCRTLFSHPGAYGVDDLRDHLAPEVRRVLSELAASKPAVELHKSDRAGATAEALRDVLERHLFDAGVSYRRLAELSLVSEEAGRRQASEKRLREENERDVQVMDRKEKKIKRLAGILKDEQVQGVLAQVADERLKGLLYAKLMEDDAVRITAEDLLSKASGCGEEVVQMIYKAMEGLLSSGASVSPEEIPAARADRIYAAAGAKVFEIDPASTDEPKIHAFPDALRSVRAAETPEGVLILGGSRQGVRTMLLGEKNPELLNYPLPNGRAIKGGINSMAMDRGRLLATHSEFGLAAWDLDRPGSPAELLHTNLTSAYRTTRGVQIDEAGRILFASGPHVFAAKDDAVVKYVSSVESPATCVAVAARTLFAGTENGTILCWKLDAPDQPVILARKREAIVNLRLAKICGLPHLLYSAKDLSIRARVIGQALETSYESEGHAVGVLDAASDLLCASDAEGRRVLLWKSTSPARPERRIDVYKRADKPVLDLWMRKIRAKTA